MTDLLTLTTIENYEALNGLDSWERCHPDLRKNNISAQRSALLALADEFEKDVERHGNSFLAFRLREVAGQG